MYIFYAAAGLLLYVGGISAPYFSDDFTVFFPPGTINPFALFVMKNPYEPTVYRPLEVFFNATVQIFFGESTFPIHLAHIALHITIACLIHKALIRLTMDKVAAGIGGTLFLAAQSAVSVVARNCTMAQQLSALFCLLFSYVLAFSEKKRKRLTLCALFALALISKETSISLLASAAFLHFLLAKKPGRVIAAAKECVPYALLTAAYLCGRLALGLEIVGTTGRQMFGLGLNVVRNIGLLLFSTVNQTSAPEVFKAFVLRDYALLGGAFAVAALLLAAIYVGFRKQKKIRWALTLATLMGISYFPVALMDHVSEVYVYNALAFFCMLAGIGVGALFKRGKALRALGLATTLIVLTVNVLSLRQGLGLIVHNAQTAQSLIEQIRDTAADSPPGATVHLIDTDHKTLRYAYSLYYMTEASTLQYGWKKSFLYFLRRDDVHFAYRTEADVAYIKRQDGDLLLTVQNGRVVPYTGSE